VSGFGGQTGLYTLDISCVASNCCIANGGIGCDDATCQACVCGVDPFCCSTAWDGICAGEAAGVCAASCPCGAPVQAPSFRTPTFDILPNVVEPNAGGVVSTAIYGNAAFDVGQIDVSTVSISWVNGDGEPVPVFADSVVDLGAGDGVMDRLLDFDTNAMRNQLKLDSSRGTRIQLLVSGELLDGTPFKLSDTVFIPQQSK
jgi:hypothetical protein